MTKRTLQEIADFFGCWVAIDPASFLAFGYSRRPDQDTDGFSGGYLGAAAGICFVSDLPEDWKDSLTAPSEPPYKEGELVIHNNTGGLYRWHENYIKECYHRPTEAEWKKLRGESE